MKKAEDIRLIDADEVEVAISKARAHAEERGKPLNLARVALNLGLGTVVIDSQTMTDAIHKTETADQALTFAAVNDIIHKGKVQLDGNVAAIGTIATLNGNTHEVVLTASRMNNGNFWVTGITMDGDAVIYDARNYLQQAAESATEQDTAEQGATEQSEISAKLVDGQDSGFDYDSLNRITQTSGQQAPVSAAAPAAQGNVAAMDSGVANQTPAFEQQKSAAVEGVAQTINSEFEEKNISNGERAITFLINEAQVAENPEKLIVKNAMFRPDIGNIDFVWGVPGNGNKFKHGYGIAHIIAKRNSENGSGIRNSQKNC